MLLIISLYKIFKKAGRKGWESIIPFYNACVLFEIVGIPGWLGFIPGVNSFVLLYAYIKLAEYFGKSKAFGLLTIFFPYICLPILAFDKETVYIKSNNKKKNI